MSKRADGAYTISLYMGKGELGRKRVESLRKIAKGLGFTWGGDEDDPDPSIGRMAKSIADGKSKVCPLLEQN